MSVCYNTNYLYSFIYSCMLLKYILLVSYCLVNNKIANHIFNLTLNNLVQFNNNIKLKILILISIHMDECETILYNSILTHQANHASII